MVFERFRRPRWQHRDPAVRRREVARLSPQDPEQARQLRVLAMEDPDDSVRTVATKRMDDLAVLRRISEAEEGANVREAASLRYRQLMAGGVGEDGGLEARLAELEYVRDPRTLAHVVRNAREESFRAEALERVADSGVLEQVALNDERFRIRQAAVQRLTDIEVLDRIATQGRSIDRRIARMARERAEELREADAERERRVQLARNLCEQAREIVDRPRLSGTEHAEAERVRNRWEGLGALPERAPRDRFRVLMNRLEARLDEAQPSEDTEQARAELEDALAALEASDDPSEETLERLRCAYEALPASAETALRRAGQWLEAGRRYQDQLDALDPSRDAETRRAAAQAVAWPDELPEPDLVRAARELADDAASEEVPAGAPDAAEAAEPPADAESPEDAGSDTGGHPDPDPESDAAIAALTNRLDELDDALEAGHYKAARRALKAARSAAERVPDSISRDQQHRLARGGARLAELEDWWRFAVLPKQRDLCERMEALVTDDQLSPPDRARRIRELREEWRATGGGGSGEARQLWERFSQAAEQAFEPCKEYFEREAERKRANLASRQQIADQLASFVDGTDLTNVATEELDRIRRTARSDWKTASPVDRDAVAEVSERFEALMDRLTAVIEERRQAGRERKQALVDELQALLSWQDMEAAAERAKALQAEWRSAGQTWAATERELRQAFRGACDRIFEAREAARAAARERSQAIVAEAERICDELESLANSESMDDSAMADRLADLRRQFRELSLPEDKVGRALGHRFRRAEAAVEQKRSGRQAERHRSALASALEHLGNGGSLEALPEALPQAFSDAVARVEPSAADPAERCRELCVQLEIRAGLDSPEAEQELRLQQQVDRLADGMVGDGEAGGDPWQMMAEWAALGGADDTAQRQRVEAAMAVLLREAAA